MKILFLVGSAFLFLCAVYLTMEAFETLEMTQFVAAFLASLNYGIFLNLSRKST